MHSTLHYQSMMMSWYDADKSDSHPPLLTHLDHLSCSLCLLTTPATDCWARVIPPPDCTSCRAWGRTPSVSPRCLATANFGLLKKGAFCNLSEMETLCHYISCAGGSCCGAGTALSPVQLLLHSSVVRSPGPDVMIRHETPSWQTLLLTESSRKV